MSKHGTANSPAPGLGGARIQGGGSVQGGSLRPENRKFAAISNGILRGGARGASSSSWRQGLGGTLIVSGGGGKNLPAIQPEVPFFTTISENDGQYDITVKGGVIYKDLLKGEILKEMEDFEVDGEDLNEGDFICITYDYPDDQSDPSILFAIKEADELEPPWYDVVAPDDDDVPEYTIFPIAEIYLPSDADDGKLVARSLVDSHLQETVICYEGEPLRYFLPI